MSSFVGCWIIKSCSNQGKNIDEVYGLEGTKFCLAPTGDVTWIPEKNSLENIPIFSCETYTIHTTNYRTTIRFGGYGEHFEFKASAYELENDLVLNCEGWCTLHCNRYNNIDLDFIPIEDYSFLTAVEEGFFSDITIETKDHKQFLVHSTILGLLGNDLPWTSHPPPFTGLPEGVVGSIIHWLYTECLPNAMTEDIAIQVIDIVKDYPCMTKLVENCQTYIRNMGLKKQIIDLVNDIHTSAERIIEYFNEPGEGFGINPVKLCLVIKQAGKEAAVVLLKIVMLCDLFTKRKTELTRSDKHEVFKYARSCLPEFTHQLRTLLEVLKNTFNSLTQAQKHEIATYLVPEIEGGIETLSSLVFDFKMNIEHVMKVVIPDTAELLEGVGDAFPSENALRKVLKVREYFKLKHLYQKTGYTLMQIMQKKECFADMTPAGKIRSVFHNLEQIIEELPVFLLRLEEVNTAVDDEIQWREFKFCFKVATSKVSGILAKLVLHNEIFHDTMVKICSLVQRDAFTIGVVNLGLLKSTSSQHQIMSSSGLNGEQELEQDKKDHQSSKSNKKRHNNFTLNLVGSLMRSPKLFHSDLSKASEKLLDSEQFTDMVFEIPVNNSHSGKSPISQMNEQLFENLSASISTAQEQTSNKSSNPNIEESATVIIKAHRVVLASRCDWFRRALQSGMIEAIHKRIVIHDTSPTLFRKLLYYLYTGKLNTDLTSPEQLSELVLLGDRYELDALKLACEKSLSSRHLNKDNIFYYLNFADQYNAEYLKELCIEFIVTHGDMIHGEQYAELSPSLQSAISSFRTIMGNNIGKMNRSRDTESEQLSLESLLEDVNIDDGSESSSTVDEIVVDEMRFRECMVNLLNILGPDIPLDLLERIAIAADCDPNRAINFYYSSMNTRSGRTTRNSRNSS
ncbi:uncharacterized protein LOC143921733 [Arctopsyche grandis]|uniref:uncharacterized protein LOC143921733 n=1 Tax=Arctopsyche grandis TaxID=121162 RepID=UPI00406D9421